MIFIVHCSRVNVDKDVEDAKKCCKWHLKEAFQLCFLVNGLKAFKNDIS